MLKIGASTLLCWLRSCRDHRRPSGAVPNSMTSGDGSQNRGRAQEAKLAIKCSNWPGVASASEAEHPKPDAER